MKVVSLFANIGVAEAYLEEIGFKIVLANELIPRRAELYSKIYSQTKTISGDFADNKVFQLIVNEAIKLKVDIVMATPPCQGMSTAGQQKLDDHRNNLIIPTIEFIKKVKPKYVFIENVPQFLKTQIYHRGKSVLIPDLINKELQNGYEIQINLVDAQKYSVPQTRERAILLFTRKDVSRKWSLPQADSKIITMHDAIGYLPTLDPFIKDISEKELIKIFPDFYRRKEIAMEISEWHRPPEHVKRQVIAMMHTPTGKSAFNNVVYRPVKQNGEAIKGFPNTYKRQNWDRAAYTITMDNVKISSQNNVHPGRFLGKNSKGQDIYSDARVLTLYELMQIMSLPKNWHIPPETSEAFLRRIIGEGIPPLLVKKIFKVLKIEKN
jgi:DNA (cytosine-5)-methyltransferase 1